jgi:hypothetical protein
MGEKRNAYGVLVGTLEGRKPPARNIRMWEYNFKMDLKEIISGVMDSNDLALLHICHTLPLLVY